jgi:CreA protein
MKKQYKKPYIQGENLMKRRGMRSKAFTLTTAAMLSAAGLIQAEEIGEVSTKFRMAGPNDKIVVAAFDDPRIPGATCYLSRAKTGGLSGAVGLAEDTADASIACRQTGPIKLPEDIANGGSDGEEVFKERTSILFKTLQVVRFYDPRRRVIIYLTYSDRLVDGSPKNSISVVPIRDY